MRTEKVNCINPTEYRSLKAMASKLQKKMSFGVNTMIELKKILHPTMLFETSSSSSSCSKGVWLGVLPVP
jgi:hypothetical protein